MSAARAGRGYGRKTLDPENRPRPWSKPRAEPIAMKASGITR